MSAVELVPPSAPPGFRQAGTRKLGAQSDRLVNGTMRAARNAAVAGGGGPTPPCSSFWPPPRAFDVEICCRGRAKRAFTARQPVWRWGPTTRAKSALLSTQAAHGGNPLLLGAQPSYGARSAQSHVTSAADAPASWMRMCVMMGLYGLSVLEILRGALVRGWPLDGPPAAGRCADWPDPLIGIFSLPALRFEEADG